MSAAAVNYVRIRDALEDGSLKPDQLRQATGLTSGQISKALGWASEQERPLGEIVAYDMRRRLYVRPVTVQELAQTQIPYLKGAVTRCDRTLSVIDFAEQRFGGLSPDMLRTKKTVEAHRESALEMLQQMQMVAAS